MGGRLGEWLSDLSVLGISAATFVVLVISALAGRSIGQLRINRSKVTDDPNDRSQGQEEYLLGGSLALLALLLAFTFGLVLTATRRGDSWSPMKRTRLAPLTSGLMAAKNAVF